MNLDNILFIGGPARLASVQVRCVDIANKLGCATCIDPRSSSDIPHGFSVYVCIKPRLGMEALEILALRGKVVWDIIDEPPPGRHITTYIASTQTIKTLFQGLGNIELIRHHHCNVERRFPERTTIRPGWIGYPKWAPDLSGLEYDIYDARTMSRLDVLAAHEKMGIGLNVRRATFQAHIHARLSSGIKLINCIGCGIPSISSEEPGYKEIGNGCTLFIKDLSECAEAVRELSSNTRLYDAIRARCLVDSEKFHLDNVVVHYRNLLEQLARE